MASAPRPSPTLFTIGYEGVRFGNVRDALRAAGVELVIDVRAIAASRRAGFSKTVLAAGLAEAGIEYRHLRDLGTPKPGRDAARRGDVATMERVFRTHMDAPEATRALAEATALASGRPACLLCFERSHLGCHRRLVAEMISDDTGQTVVALEPERGTIP